MFPVVDMHCDTLAELRRARLKGESAELRVNNLQVDLKRMREGGYLLQNFATFVDLHSEEDPLAAVLSLIDLFYEEAEKNRDIFVTVKSFADIRRAQAEGKVAGMLTLEESGFFHGDPGLLRDLYRLGIRMMTLTWNYENDLGYPNGVSPYNRCSGADTERGLKEAGIAILKEAERLGILPDVSHLSDKGFEDVLKHTKKPVVASHSNARALCPHVRNLTDEMIRRIGERGGVIGLNYCAAFLDTNPVYENNVSTAALMVKHARHITNVGGREVLGLGSDFDGISGNLEIDHCGRVPLLADALHEGGFTGREIEGILSGNVLRVYREVLGEQDP